MRAKSYGFMTPPFLLLQSIPFKSMKTIVRDAVGSLLKILPHQQPHIRLVLIFNWIAQQARNTHNGEVAWLRAYLLKIVFIYPLTKQIVGYWPLFPCM